MLVLPYYAMYYGSDKKGGCNATAPMFSIFVTVQFLTSNEQFVHKNRYAMVQIASSIMFSRSQQRSAGC
jgi:hypothetical protein